MLLRVITLALTVLMATAGLACASDADFTLKNKTGYQIDELYVSPHSRNSWGRDRMGDDALLDGEAVEILSPHGSTVCNFDIKVKYHDADVVEWGDVDLCQFSTISLYWDAKRQVTRAVGE